jgi:PAS domain S-box-containing protein
MYRILYVDDEPGLLEIGKLFLEQSGQFIVDTVTSAPAALTLLNAKPYDAIIADYQMPEMDGIEFLKKVRTSGNTIPFILFTGRGREEVVIQALNEGADFYLQKGGEPRSQFAELSNKIQYAVMRRRAETELRGASEQITAQEGELRRQYDSMVALQQRTAESQQMLSSIIDFLPDATFAIDTAGKVISWNKAIETMTGIRKEDILGQGDFCYALPFYGERRRILINLILNFDESFAAANYHTVQRVGETLFSEAYVPRMRGETEAYLWFTASPLYSKDGVLTGAIESIRDITHFKRIEQALRVSEEQYRRIVETADEGIAQLDEKFETVYVNRRMAEMLGYTPEETLGRNIASFMAAEDIPDNTSRIQERSQGKNGRYERRFVTKDGRIRWLQVSTTTLMDPDGTFRGSFAMCSDITDRKAAEEEIVRRNEELHLTYEQLIATEQELQQNFDELAESQKLLEASEKKYRDVVEDQTEFISRFLPDGTHVFVNEAYCRYFGLKREEILGHRFRPVVPEEDGRRIKEMLAALTPENPVNFIRQRVIFPDGSIRWQRWSDRAIFDDAGNLVEYQSVGRDITDVKMAEKALLESEQRYRNVVEDQTEFICRFLPDDTHIFVNDAYCRYFNLKREEIVGHRFRPRIPAEDQERVKRFFASLAPDHPIDQIEHRIIMPDGALRWQRWSDRAIFDPLGTVTEYQSVGRDITEEKATQTALEKSEIRFRLQYQNNPLAIFIWQHREGDFILIDCNKAAEALTGGRSHEFLGRSASGFYATRPELISLIGHCFSERIAISQELVAENFLPGGLIHATAAFVPPDLIMVHMDDITERKEAEEALRNSEERFRKIFENSPLGMSLVTPSFRFFSVNPAWVSMTGYTEEELLKMSFKDITHPDDLTGDLEHMQELTAGTIPVYSTEKRYIRKDNRILWGLIRVTALRDQQGSLRYFTAQVEDITERKEAEEAVRASEKRFHELSDLLPLVVYEVDGEGTLKYTNHIAFDYFGYTEDDFRQGLSVMQMLAPDDADRAAADFRAIVEGDGRGVGSVNEYMALRKDGSTFPISIYSSPIVENGRITGFRGIVIDITERKEAEEALRRANRQLSLLSGITRHDILNKIPVILGYVQLAEMRSGDPALAEYLGNVESAATEIQSQIEFSRIYQDLGTHEPQWIALDKVMPLRSQVPATMTLNAAVKGVTVFADPMLEKVFFNLLDNSIRHGERVTDIRVSSQKPGEVLVVLWEDNGIGVAADEKERIFEPGFGKNTGLGMFLIREILSLTGITIRETGEPGNGARFEITVPNGKYRFSHR